MLTCQGYALIEFAQKEEAERAIKETSGTTFLEKTIHTLVPYSSGLQQ
jgi:RNA-binding protein 8A